tara:strand:+ start:197 stop:865 length:669 start_codon:yes stop_codon:yes gene_type:complete
MNSETLIQKSIAAHGGLDMLKTIKSIQYTKSTSLYTKSGALEKTVEQYITHQWNPDQTSIAWVSEESTFFAEKNSNEVSLFKDGEMVKDSLERTQAAANIDAALYVFWQPFKLTDSSAKKVYLGKQKILDSIEVLTVKVSYSDDPKADVWFYYFHPENYKVKAVKVKHNRRTSLILNDRYETQTGLSLNKTRRSFFLDTLGKIDYLRAAYQYEIDSIKLNQK